MKKEQQQFMEYLEDLNRYQCLKYIEKLTEKNKIHDIYEQVLGPSLIKKASKGIWQEHAMTSIVLNCIDQCYLKVDSEISLEKKAIVFCPEEEYHELGARMVNDFLVLLGCETTYIGANLPLKAVIDAIKDLKPDYIVISITNAYHLFNLKNTIAEIKKLYNITIIVGGSALKVEGACYQSIGADYCAHNYVELKEIMEQEL